MQADTSDDILTLFSIMSFKIYFAGSIRGGRQDTALYERIIKQLQQYGHVFTEHVGNPDLEKG